MKKHLMGNLVRLGESSKRKSPPFELGKLQARIGREPGG